MLDFFLDSVIDTAHESIAISKKITTLREEDMRKLQSLGKREAESGIKLLQHLYKSPIVTVSNVAEHINYTRNGAQKVIDRFISLNILQPKDETDKYGRSYIYSKYIYIFNEATA